MGDFETRMGVSSHITPKISRLAKPYHSRLAGGGCGILANKFESVIPEIIDLPECDYLMFQGKPFVEEDYCDVIFAVQTAMNRYAPSVIGYCWDDSNPRIQLEPRGERGYIEMRAIRKEKDM